MPLNFSGQNLRGRNFRGQDLTGADFSRADIRGASFTNANLEGANFTEAKAGLQKRWLFTQLFVVFVLSAILNFSLIILNAINITSLLTDSGSAYIVILGLFSFGVLTVVFFAIIQQGTTAKAVTTITIAVILFFVVASVAAFAGALATAVAAVTTLTTSIVINVAVIIFLAIAAAVRNASVFIAVVVTAFVAIIVAGKITVNTSGSAAVAIATAVAISLLTGYITWRVSKGDERFSLVCTIGTAIGAIGGTSFCGADLTYSSFERAILKSTNFNHANQKKTVLMQVFWKGSQKFDRARLGNSYLADPKIRQLVITLNGQDQNYNGLSLEGVNLQGANLQDAKFAGSNLNHSTLQDANLSRAILKQTQLDEANLTGVILTGAYIEDWGITGTTDLTDVQCKYVFMRVPTKEDPNPLRKPDNLRENFANGEFTDFIKPFVDTLDLYHSQDVDPRAISIALKNLSQNHPDANLELVAIEKRGQNSLNLKMQTAPTADKSELSAEYFADYNQIKALSPEARLLLADKDAQIRRFEQMFQTALNQPTFHVQGDFMPEQSGININAGESIGNISGLVGGDVSGVVNLGTISGNLTTAINQLPNETEPNQPSLKDLLNHLQKTIESATELSVGEKTILLEQVNALTEARQVTEPEKKRSLVQKAQGMFEGILKSLPDTAKIAESVNKLLPMILKALGIPT